jgi:hypothetical protein
VIHSCMRTMKVNTRYLQGRCIDSEDFRRRK